MLHCFITPTHYVNDPEIGGQSDFLLALSHLIDQHATNEYAQAIFEFKKSGKPVFLDNGLFENHVPEAVESLIHKAMLIGADYVFAPDHLYKREETQKAFDEFYEISKEMGAQFKFAYVVQADDPSDYVGAFFDANLDERIDMIWLSILSIPKSFESLTMTTDITTNRVVCMELLQEALEQEWIKSKPCHMLGLWESLIDLVEGRKYPWIYSNDSSSAFQTGKHLKTYEHLKVPGGKVHEKVVFEQTELTPEQRSMIIKNVAAIKEIVQPSELICTEDTILR